VSIRKYQKGSSDDIHPLDGYYILQRRVLQILLSIGFIAIGFVLFFGDVYYVRSFVLGLALGLLSFKILSRNVGNIARSGKTNVAAYAVRIFFIRYLLAGAGLLLVAKGGIYSILSYMVAFFLPHIIIAIACVMRGKIKPGESHVTGAGL
jgi:hypothetical protein